MPKYIKRASNYDSDDNGSSSESDYVSSDENKHKKKQIKKNIKNKKKDNKDHKEVLCNILNTFSAVNEGFGYPQGLNFLVCPLFYVYYNEDPKMAVRHTFYSLHGLVHIVLPLYPLHSRDDQAIKTLQAVANIVSLQCYNIDSNMEILFF